VCSDGCEVSTPNVGLNSRFKLSNVHIRNSQKNKKSEAMAQRRAIKAMQQTKPVEILLVEDSPVDIRMTQEAFKEQRVANNLHVVTDGELAMDFVYQRGQYAAALRPDIILLDLNLPKKDGREVLDEIKTDDKLRSIPVVVLTTSELDVDVISSYCKNANAFLNKPIEFNDFLTMMRTIGDFWLSFVKLPEAPDAT